MKIIERIYDATTGETQDTEREMTEQELLEHQNALAKAEQILAEENERKVKRAEALSKLAAIGLTEDDLKALGL